jgi:tetratricopeptide (TPR) repeat protein
MLHQHHDTRSGSDLARLLQQAHALHAAGDLPKAEKLYKTILARDPGQFDALHLLGIIKYQNGKPAEALRYLAAALKRNAGSAEVLASQGLALHALGRCADACASYAAALAITPDDADLLNKHGVALLGLGRPQDALVSFDRALALDPRHAEALGNRGNALIKLNRPDEALASYDAMRVIAGDSARLLTNRAHALRRLDRLDAALADLQKAVAIDDDFAEAQFELGLVELARGNFAAGWTAYERRWATQAFAVHRRDFKSPRWTGAEPLQGRIILLHAEQGFGDTIQFVRYVTLVRQLGATVLLEVQPELKTLIEAAGLGARVIGRGDKLSAFDLHCPLLSLPLACRTFNVDGPAAVPYLKAPEARVAQWASRIAPAQLRIGVAWAGRRTHENDANRSIALSRLAPLFAATGVAFVSLQRDLGDEDRALLRSFGNVLDAGDALHDFIDTAAAIAALDAVVSIDSAVAHLAGALAKPVLVMLPRAADFRWLRERTDSIWYPSAKLFRQPTRGDWDGVIADVCAHVAALKTSA